MNKENSISTVHKTLHDRLNTTLDKIRPYLIADGGNVVLKGIGKHNSITLKLTGNCMNCPLSYMTFKTGIEKTIKDAIPEVGSIHVIGMHKP